MMRCLRALIMLCTLTTVVLTPLVCDGQEPEKPDAENLRSLSAGNTDFAIDLYRAHAGERGNLSLSPYSVSSALAMTYAGANGNTAAEMADVLNFALEDRDLHKAFGSLNADLNTRAASGDLELRVANALWGQIDQKFLGDYIDLTRKFYNAELNTVDFAGDPEFARRRINIWASQQTDQKITELIGPGMVDRATVLVLSNAIYFKGAWANKFDRQNTREEPFWVGADSSVTVDMMHQTRSFRYTETSGLRILELPYVGGDLSMIVFLPKERGGLSGVERFLTPKSLRIWLRQLREEEVMVSLPRFRVTSGLLLDESLEDMGMTDAFDIGLADFSGMTGRRELFIDAVIHKAVVEVAEEGTEAAAATAVVMAKESLSKSFRADHPFLFMIRDNTSKSILFIGRLADPLG